ncbi:MAG: 16S rRNA (cytidine(1402)-2'-O)-methyltransferase [Gammaproteobacteria bacterium]|nr:16S rRNA (cytidine(1402)-2'-O)-methyltransferase [Gammaproteobacteria bacterium]
MTSHYGTLYVVATPIGNLDDITKRAIDVLKEADRVLAEDTRRTQQLFNHLGIKNKLVSLHDHNERNRVSQVVDWIEKGEKVALVSDAGTPLISDPGYHLVKELRQKNLSVVPIPGVSAIITALSVCGLPTDRFSFEGFLPAKQSNRLQVFESLENETRTWVFYESSHRIVASLNDLAQVFESHRQVCVARELTKRFETIYTGTIEQAIEKLTSDPVQQKGEFVVMVEGAANKQDVANEELQKTLKVLLTKLSTKDAAQIAADLTGVSKKALYQMALALKE